MREIKFRTWDKKNKLMDYQNDVAPTFGNYRHDFGDVLYYHKNNFILMQYTGLKDKREKGIYEDDIITWERLACDGKPRSIENSKVYFDEGWGQWRMWITRNCCFDLAGMLRANKEMLVIGNIHETPNLLPTKEG